MSVINVVATIVLPVKDPPLRSPIDGRVDEFTILGKVWRLMSRILIGESRPWTGWFSSLSNIGSQIVVTATVDFGVIPGNSAHTEAIPSAPAEPIPVHPPLPAHCFIIVANPPKAGLVFVANIYVFQKIQVWAINYTGAPITPGPIDMRFLVIPELAG